MFNHKLNNMSEYRIDPVWGVLTDPRDIAVYDRQQEEREIEREYLESEYRRMEEEYWRQQEEQ